MMDVCCALLGLRSSDLNALRGIGPRERIKLNRILRNAKIDIHPAASVKGGTQQQLKLKIKKGISHLTARRHSFDSKNDNGKHESVTVENYFLEHYRIRLQYPDLPMVETRADTFYPIELCELSPGHKFNKRLSPSQTGKATAVQLLK